MNASTTNTHDPANRPAKQLAPITKITINSVGTDRPRAWLIAGIEDFRRATTVSLLYGMFWVGLSVAITLGAYTLGYWYWLLPLIAGFMFIGPLVAIGSYGISRALEQGRVPRLSDVFGSGRRHAGQLAMMGVMMMIFFLAWIRLATLLFALFFGLEAPSAAALYTALLTTPEGIGMLAVGTMTGGILAFGAFTLSAVAIPTLMDQDLTFMEGIEASVRCVAKNFSTMLIWAAILTGCVLVGVMTFYIGFALILPVLGYASWHAYEELVRFEAVEELNT